MKMKNKQMNKGIEKTDVMDVINEIKQIIEENKAIPENYFKINQKKIREIIKEIKENDTYGLKRDVLVLKSIFSRPLFTKKNVDLDLLIKTPSHSKIFTEEALACINALLENNALPETFFYNKENQSWLLNAFAEIVEHGEEYKRETFNELKFMLKDERFFKKSRLKLIVEIPKKFKERTYEAMRLIRKTMC